MPRALHLLWLMAVLAAACTPTEDEGSSPNEPAGDRSIDVVGSDELAFSAEENLEIEVRLALVEPESFRPDEVAPTDQSAVILADLLYDGLTETDGDGQALRPALAESWSADDGFRRWTFELDANGPVTALDVVESFGRLGDADRPGAVQAVARTIEAVVAIDEDTVAVDLAAPDAGFPWIVSGLPFSIIGPDGRTTGRYEIAVGLDDDAGDDPSGGGQLRLEPVESGRGPTVIVTWAESASDAYDRLALGEVDAALTPPDSVEDAELRFGANFPAGATTRFYVLNKASAALSTSEARRSVLAAVDRADLPIELIDATGVAVDGIVPASAAGAGERGCGETCEFDPAVAEAAAGSGVGADRPLLVAYVGEEERAMAEAVVADLIDVGFEAEVLALTPDELAARIVAGDVDLFSFGWIAPATSIDAVIPPLLASGSPTNVVRADGAPIPDLLARAATTGDHEARWELLARAHRLALSDGLILPISGSTSTLARAPHAEALVVRTDGSLDLADLG